MKKSKITIIAMFVLLIVFIVLFIVFFNVADGFKGRYDELAKLLASKKVQKDPVLVAQYTAEQGAVNGSYSTFALLSYIVSILAIATLGIGLAVADKFKTAEEKKAEDGLEVLVKPGTSKKHRKAPKAE